MCSRSVLCLVLVIVSWINGSVASESAASSTQDEPPVVQRRMMLVPPGDIVEGEDPNGIDALTDSGFPSAQPRANDDGILTPQQLLTALYDIRSRQRNKIPTRQSSVSSPSESTNNSPTSALTSSGQTRQQNNSKQPQEALRGKNNQIQESISHLHKPAPQQGLSPTWKFLFQMIRDVTSTFRPTNNNNDNNKKEEESPVKNVRENASSLDGEKDNITRLVGAILGRYDCWKHAACKAGKYMGTFRGKNIVLLFLERWAPNSWIDTLRVAKSAAIYGDSCDKFYCPIPE